MKKGRPPADDLRAKQWFQAALDEKGRLVMHGEHATEIVHVTVVISSAGRAILRWSDGIMGPLPDIRLKRP